MKAYAAIISAADNYVERRAPHRPAHFAYLEKLLAEGKLALAGAWSDRIDGALIIYWAESKEEVERIIADDPYMRAGLWPKVEIREWLIAVGRLDAPVGAR